MSIAATGLIYLSYLLCNIGVLVARLRGWPHKAAWFNLGRWGTIINVLGARLRRADDRSTSASGTTPSLFGDFGGDGRAFTNPFIKAFFMPFGKPDRRLPAIPIFETLVGLVLIVGAIYYARRPVRGRAA